MPLIEIRRWDTGAVIFSGDYPTVHDALESGVREGVDFYRASLDGASLDGARLIGASLDGASLDGASLIGASLDGARLIGARLDGASLDGARLDGASLDGARLDGASLDVIKGDLWVVLSSAKPEVPGLLRRLREGRIDGSTYSGPCCCLVGSLASERQVAFDCIEGLRPDADRPAERWFLAIKPGHTPETSPIAKLTEGWIVEFCALAGIPIEVPE